MQQKHKGLKLRAKLKIASEISYACNGVISTLNRVVRRFSNADNLVNTNGYKDFAPRILTGQDDKYSETLKYAVDNHNIKNVALTGPYGSGKSTILKTFEHRYPEFQYLNLSLSTF